MTALQLFLKDFFASGIVAKHCIMHGVPSVETILHVSDPFAPSHSQLTTVPGQVGTGGLQVRLKSANEDKLLVAASRRAQR